VVSLLQKSLRKVGLKATVTALVNDTVGTLAAKAYSTPRCMIGLILGTGTNAAYVEKVESILKLPAEIRKQGGDMVINTEWGAFGEGNSRLLPVTSVDVTLDRESRNPGQQTFEKMISGAYLGEITRLCMLKLHEEGALWCGQDGTDDAPNVVIPECMLQRNGFESRFLSDIEYDMSPDLSVVQHVETLLGIQGSSLQDRKVVQEVCAMVVERAARLTACGVTAATRQLGSRGVGCTVGIDGSVFELHPTFADRLRQALRTLGCNVEVALSKDGSGKGAALIAASLDRLHRTTAAL
jgi:hexokinase